MLSAYLLLALSFIRSSEPNDNRHFHIQLFKRHDDPVGNHVALRQAAEDVDKDCLDTRIRAEDFEALLDSNCSRLAARVEEIGRVASSFDQGVHSVHGKSSAIDCRL